MKIDDMVVVRKQGSLPPGWVEPMMDFVGETGRVVGVCGSGDGGALVLFDNGKSWYYTSDEFELVEKYTVEIYNPCRGAFFTDTAFGTRGNVWKFMCERWKYSLLTGNIWKSEEGM